MGTRGAFGVVIGEKEKIGYNQFDSYPSGQGIANLKWLRDADLDEVRRQAEAARLVNGHDSPTPADIEALAGYTNLNVSDQSTDDWYCLTRETHGDIGAMLACGYICDYHEFPLDSLFCEWAYIVDLDNNVFEVYQGFQLNEHSEGRFADRMEKAEGGYWPVKLIASWPFIALPTDKQFLDIDKEED